jgi:glycosyltransferase involved in cell wall biosynthesis
MRVLHVVSGDLYAGAERIVEELAVAQHSCLKMQVFAAVLNEGRLAHNLRQAGVDTHVFDEQTLGTAALLVALRRCITITRPDVVHTHRFKENVLGGLTAVGSAASIRTVHGAPEFSRSRTLRDRLVDTLDRFVATRLQRRIVCVSRELCDRLSANYPRGSLETIVNGIDGARVRAAAAASVPALAGEVRVGVFARLVPVKRIDVAVDVVSRARQQLGTDVTLHIFGDGPLESALRSAAAGARGIIFHGTTQQAPAYMRQMHALLMTSSHEGLPVAALEAMALSVPVVATRTGGLPHLLADGDCGWLVDANDADGYVRALVEAVSLTQERSMKVAAARERVGREFGATRMAEDYFRIYAAIARAHRHATGAGFA